MKHFGVRRTSVIMLGLFGFLAGLVMARLGARVSEGLVLASILLALVTITRLRAISFYTIVLVGVMLGCLRGQVLLHNLLPLKQMSGERVTVRVRAVSDAVYDTTTQLSFDADSLHFIKPQNVHTPGRLKIGGFGTTAVYRGDIVQVEGKLYATRGSAQGSIKFADLHVLARNTSAVDRIRLKFIAGLQTALPEPLASFGTGLLIGQRTTIPAEITQNLSAVGLTHIVAVSGYNLTIIVLAVMWIMRRNSKFQTMAVVLTLIGLFLLLTGLSASIVRAAVVSILTLWAWYYGRTFRPVLLLLLAACITAGWNPLYIWGDIGWYLSFTAFFGILVLAPLIKERFFGTKNVKLVGLVVLETLCAQIMTTPLILYVFQQVSLVALAANVFVVPLVPLAMLLTLIAGLAGMLVPSIAGWFAWPARIVLTYMLDVVALFARVPHALIERSLSAFGMATLYAVLLTLCWMMWRKISKQRGKSVTITDTNSIF